jgi:hypothetical protein
LGASDFLSCQYEVAVEEVVADRFVFLVFAGHPTGGHYAMTINEFLAELQTQRRAARLQSFTLRDERIRTADTECLCPIAELAYCLYPYRVLKPREVSVRHGMVEVNVHAAGRALGLTLHRIDSIIDAADHRSPRRLRRQLLSACGLKEVS